MSKRNDFSERGVALVALGTFVFMLAVAAMIYVLFPDAHLEREAAISDLPGPDLEVRPVEDYNDWAARQAALLAGAAGRMPIADAMARVMSRDDPYAPVRLPQGAGR